MQMKYVVHGYKSVIFLLNVTFPVTLNIISCSSTGQCTFAVRVVILYLTIYPVIIPFGLHGSSQYNVTEVELTL